MLLSCKETFVLEGKIVGEIIFLGYYENDFDWLESPEKVNFAAIS